MNNKTMFNNYINYCNITKQNKNKIEALKNYLQLIKELKEFEKITL